MARWRLEIAAVIIRQCTGLHLLSALKIHNWPAHAYYKLNRPFFYSIGRVLRGAGQASTGNVPRGYMSNERNVARVLWLGYGALARTSQEHLQAASYQLTAARRSRAALPAQLPGIAMDVTRPDTLAPLASQHWDAVVVTLTAASNEVAYRSVYVDGLANVLEMLERNEQPPLIVFASSTSVYGQRDGSLVDEHSDTLPNSFSGRCLLQAERLLAESKLDACTLRFSGIYGGQRNNHLLEVLRHGRICPAMPLNYSNRIHVEDCARVILHVLDRYRSGHALAPVYLACDNNPAPLRDVMLWLAARHKIATAGLVEDYLPSRGGNKRCSAGRLQAEGFCARYADYREGFAATQ